MDKKICHVTGSGAQRKLWNENNVVSGCRIGTVNSIFGHYTTVYFCVIEIALL